MLSVGSYSWRFYGHDYGYTVIEHHSPEIVDANGFALIKNAEVYLFDDTGGFKWILANWCRNHVDFRMYAVWARFYHGAGKFADPNTVVVTDPNEIIVDPNEPVLLPMVWVSQTGTKYHLKSCRYWRDNFQEISIFDALLDNCTPCLVCKPELIESLLKCYVPELSGGN